MQIEASKDKMNIINVINKTELAWEDSLVRHSRDLTDAMRQASEASINKLVQNNMQQIREMN